jgi:DNA-binding NtrC family response regulator
MKPKVLLVDDEPPILFGYSRYLSRAGHDITEASTLAEARKALESRIFDSVVLDMLLPDGNGIDLIEDIKKYHPSTSVIMVTGKGDIPQAVEAVRRGADNFLTKPVDMDELKIFLNKGMEMFALRQKDLAQRRLKKEYEPYFGESAGMKKVMELASVAAENSSYVLLQGETGTGKGVLAKWIHEHGSRSSMPFVDVNCSVLRGELLASELFGHVKGAFTSAVNDKLGLVDLADGGTLFLDEIGDMDFSVQAQFLKLIEEKTYRRLGAVTPRESDFELICATNKNLEDEVAHGRFRNDLFFRINVVPITIQPLRERPEDIPVLAGSLLKNLGAPGLDVPPDVMRLFQGYSWPGNIRELKNVLERALLLSRGGPLWTKHFQGINPWSTLSSGGGSAGDLKTIEKDYIMTVVERSGGDIRKAAAELGLSRSTLYRKLKGFRQKT